MNPYNFSVLFFSFCTFILSLIVWFKRQDQIGRMYLVFSLIVAFWGSCFSIMISNNVSYQGALFASRSAGLSAIFISVTWYHFCVIYCGNMRKQNKFLVLFYLVSLGMALFAYSDWFVPRVRPVLNYSNIMVPGPLYYAHTVLFFCLVSLGFYHLIVKWKLVNGPEKNQIRGLILTTLAGFIGGSVTFLPVYEILFPQYAVFMMPIYPFGMAYFIGKKKLFDSETLVSAARRDKLAAIGILAASINHEVRSPFYVIRGSAETFLDKNKQDIFKTKEQIQDEAEKLCARITEQADKGMEIIRRLSSFAKREVDQEFHPGAVNPTEIFDNVLGLIRYEFESHQIRFEKNFPENVPTIQADPKYLEEILFNLLVNASQALKEVERERFIKVSVISENEKVKLIIRDNAKGISPEQLPHIFEPFFTTKKEGTGLGLYITKRLVERNGGKISAESEFGGGTRFILLFNRSHS